MIARIQYGRTKRHQVLSSNPTYGGMGLTQGMHISVYQDDALIIVEGYYFINERNGYVGETERQAAEKIKREALDNRMVKSTSDLSKWTKRLYHGIVFVGFGASGLVIWEIIKTWFFKNHVCY